MYFMESYNDELLATWQAQLLDQDPYLCNISDSAYSAVNSNDVTKLKRLIEAKCDVNGRGGEFSATPLILAVRLRKFEMVQLLIEANANVFREDWLNYNALHCVFEIEESARGPYVKYIVEHLLVGNNIEKVVTALIAEKCSLVDIIYVGKVKLTELFLVKKTYVVSLEESKKCIDIAFQNLDIENMKVLLQSEKLNGAKTYFWGCMYQLTGRVTEIFIEHIISWNVISENSVLILASIFETADTQVIQTFLRYNVDALVKNNFRLNVIANLFANLKIDPIYLLKDRIFNADMPTSEGLTALHLAADKTRVKCVEFLLSRGANPNVRDDLGDTPLFKIIKISQTKENGRIADILMRHEADVLLYSNNGQTFVNRIIIYQQRRQVCKNTVGHVAIAERMGRLIDESIVESINKHKSLRDYYKVCLTQLNQLMSSDIRDRLTMFVFISKKAELLSKNVNDEDQKVIRKFTSANTKSIEPCYRRLIFKKLQKIKQLRDCRDKAAKMILQNVAALKKNYYVVMEIVSYFSYAELLMFK